MTGEPDGTPSHPPMPSRPPRPIPPERGHVPPKWAWWVVGILIPVLGLVVTLIAQSGTSSSRGAPVPSSTGSGGLPAPERAVTADPSETPADDVVTTLPPPASPSEAPVKILRTGDFTLIEGYSADLEHGTVGVSVKNPDMAWSGGDEFSALNGRVADTSRGATPKTCAKALDNSSSTGWMVAGLEGTWFCMPTSANHLAAVEWLGLGDGGNRYHYIDRVLCGVGSLSSSWGGVRGVGLFRTGCGRLWSR